MGIKKWDLAIILTAGSCLMSVGSLCFADTEVDISKFVFFTQKELNAFRPFVLEDQNNNRDKTGDFIFYRIMLRVAVEKCRTLQCDHSPCVGVDTSNLSPEDIKREKTTGSEKHREIHFDPGKKEILISTRETKVETSPEGEIGYFLNKPTLKCTSSNTSSVSNIGSALSRLKIWNQSEPGCSSRCQAVHSEILSEKDSKIKVRFSDSIPGADVAKNTGSTKDKENSTAGAHEPKKPSVLERTHQAVLDAYSDAYPVVSKAVVDATPIVRKAAINATRDLMVQSSGNSAGHGNSGGLSNDLLGTLASLTRVPAAGIQWSSDFLQYAGLELTGWSSEDILNTAHYKINLEKANPDYEKVFKDLSTHFDINDAYLLPDQRKFIKDLKKEIEDNIDKLKLISLKRPLSFDEKADREKGRLLTYQFIEDQIKKEAHYPEGNDRPARNFKKQIETALRIAKLISIPVPVNVEEIKKRCKEIYAHPSWKKFLEDRCNKYAEVASAPPGKRVPAEAWMIWSGFGTYKTTGMEQLADKTGAPMCVLDEQTILNTKLPEASMQNTQGPHGGKEGRGGVNNEIYEKIRTAIMNCLFFQARINGSQLGFNAHSYLYFDDFDKVLRQLDPKRFSPNPFSTTTDHTSSNVEMLREAIFNLLKQITDPAIPFKDLNTGFPIKLSGFGTIVSSNTVFSDFNKTEASEASAVANRFSFELVAYPDENFRRQIAARTWKWLNDEILAKGRKPGNCEAILNSILKYDIDVYRDKKGKIGVRGFHKLLNDFETTTFKAELNRTPEGGEMDCSSFNVARRGAGEISYREEPDPTLFAYEYTIELREKLYPIKEDLNKLQLDKKAKEAIEQLMKDALDQTKSYEERKAKFEAIEDTLYFNKIKSPPTVAEAKEGFSSISKLIRSDQERKEWMDLFSRIYRKMEAPSWQTSADHQGENQVIVLNPEVGAEVDLIEEMAKALEVPYVKDDGEIFKEVMPKWHQFKIGQPLKANMGMEQKEFRGMPAMVDGKLVKVEYDNEKGIYRALSANKKEIYVWNPEDIAALFESMGGQFPEPALIIPKKEFEENQEVKSDHLWLRRALENWKGREGRATGFIVLKTHHPVETIEKISKVLKDPAYQFPSGQDYTVHDLRKLSVLIYPSDKTARGLLLKKKQALQERKADVFWLDLPGLKNEEGVVQWAERRFKKILEGVPPTTDEVEKEAQVRKIQSWTEKFQRALKEKVTAFQVSTTNPEVNQSDQLHNLFHDVEWDLNAFQEEFRRQNNSIFGYSGR